MGLPHSDWREVAAPRSHHRVQACSPAEQRPGDPPEEQPEANERWSFVAASEERRRALEIARRAAPADCPVLIMGPTGVGKDVLAEDIHRNSARDGKPFVAVNCAAVTPSLFESELFGHARGAYTSATTTKAGLVELADGGTLFLDEVGELPMEAQAKLLRFLAKGIFWPVGATRELRVDVRVIAATNRDLPAALGASFREDLFYRLSVVTIELPALDPADVRVLARAFAAELAPRESREASDDDLDELAELASRIPWRGGARELRNAVERHYVLREPRRTLAENWCAAIRRPRAAPRPAVPAVVLSDAGAAVDLLSRAIFLTSARGAGDVRRLARNLDCSVQTVYDRLRTYQIEPRELRHDDLLDRRLDEVRRGLAPYLPWLVDLLRSLSWVVSLTGA